MPALKAITVPLLAVYWGADQIVPVDRSIAALREAFAGSGRARLLTIRVFPGANHGLLMSPRGLDFAPGYLAAMQGWLSEVMKGSRSSAETRTSLP